MTIPLTIAAIQAMMEHIATAHTLSPLEGLTIDWITEGADLPELSTLDLLKSALSLMP